MKLVGALGLIVGGALVVGCGPGITHRAQQPGDVFAKMDKELENAISTTTLSSDVMELPSERLSVAQWEEEEAPVAQQTWGTPKAASDPGSRP